MRPITLTCVSKYLLCVAIPLLTVRMAMAQFVVYNDFKSSAAPGFHMGGSAYLTSGRDDPLNAGWLRLTADNANEEGYTYLDEAFPSTLGLIIDFEYKTWRSVSNDEPQHSWNHGVFHGGDGFSVFLFDASVPFQIGGYGGGLGYAPNAAVDAPGLAGGYIGLGFDEYGYFGVQGEGRWGGIQRDANGEEVVPNTVILRGRETTNNTGQTVGGVPPTHRFMAGVKLGNRTGTSEQIRTRNEIDYNTLPYGPRPDDDQFYRRVVVELEPIAGGLYAGKVMWKKVNDPTAPYDTLFTYTTSVPPAPFLKVGFSGSTAGAINNHDIRNVLITTPGNLRLNKFVDKEVLHIVDNEETTAEIENEVTYTVEVVNATHGPLTNISFEDHVTDGAGNTLDTDLFQVTNITATGFTAANLPTAFPLGSNQVTGTLALAPDATGYITITGRLLGLPPRNLVYNSATATPDPTEIIDPDLGNNTHTVQTPVITEGIDLGVQVSTDATCLSRNNFVVNVYSNGTDPLPYQTPANPNLTSPTSNYNNRRVLVIKRIPPGYGYDDSATPKNGWADNFKDYDEAVTDGQYYAPRSGWIRIVEPIPMSANDGPEPIRDPNAPGFDPNNLLSDWGYGGYTKYTYIARGPMINNNDATVMQPYSITGGLPLHIHYTITPPDTATHYDDITWAHYLLPDGTDDGYSGDLVPGINFENNIDTVRLSIHPDPPEVAGPVYYCLNELASPLQLDPDYTVPEGGVITWYHSEGGVPSQIPFTPPTNSIDTITYYVGLTMDGCESDLASIDVIVMGPNPGSILGSQESCAGNIPAEITSTAAAAPGGTNDPAGISYRWEMSTNGGTSWTAVEGATGASYQPPATSVDTRYRRMAHYSYMDPVRDCEAASNESVITVTACESNISITNPTLPSTNKQ
ncbi:hypothetical protein [Parapedobacter sp. DT-150]|uniref:hypothetical protein n=1 Tax=Parapedobacter sp. DT-150 TaxID=3396162 RepID=UPI003F1B0ECA